MHIHTSTYLFLTYTIVWPDTRGKTSLPLAADLAWLSNKVYFYYGDAMCVR